MSFFSSTPQCGTNQITSVGDAINKLEAFNALYAVHQAEANPELCGNADDTAMWRKLVHEGVINCGGEPMELDFFEKIFGGKTEVIDAKKIYFRYNCDIDMNIYAQNSVVGSGAGQPVTFQLLKANHTGDGKFSYPVEGYSLYIYEDNQWVYISAANKDAQYGHTFTVRPYKKNYTVNIRKNKKMMVLPVQLVSGLSCPTPSSSWQSIGYTQHVRPFRIRKDWELPIDLLRGYEEVLQFAIMFDENGKEIDCYEAFEKTQARRDMKWAKNLLFFLGQQIDNPSLLGSDSGQVTVDYSGFDGYIPTMHYGGGTVIDIDPGVGFDLDADLEPVIIRNDSLKRTNEFVVLHAKPFWLSMNRNADGKFKENAGACTFDTFKRSGSDMDEIKRLGVRSYEWANFSLHFKEVSAMSDTRGIGNYNFPHQANFIPGNGLRDSKGREVPAIQFFVPRGCGATGMLEDVDRDHRKIDGCDKLAGYMAETIMSAIHCPHQHILINPVLSC
jgi:hypothetical protein